MTNFHDKRNDNGTAACLIDKVNEWIYYSDWKSQYREVLYRGTADRRDTDGTDSRSRNRTLGLTAVTASPPLQRRRSSNQRKVRETGNGRDVVSRG